jgi:hypothetical protein
MRSISLILATLLLISFTSAIEIEPDYPTNILVKDLESSIPLTLTIKNATQGNYNLYTLADISIQPSEVFQIENNETIEKTFQIKANDNLEIDGNYAFTYTLNHRGVEKYEQKILLRLLPLEEIIEISSDTITPEEGKVSFYIENKEAVKVENITAKFQSVLFDITTTFNLEPNEKTVIPVVVDPTKLARTPAGVYVINSEFYTKRGTKEIQGTLYLGEKKGITTIEDK